MAGLVDIHQPAAEKLAAERGLSQAVVGSDVDAVLAKTGAELLFVCSVPEAHKANILSGLRHGCHVLTEKPLTATMAEARALVAATRKAKRIVSVTQNYRYRRAIRSLKKFLASGKIGRITGLDVDFYVGAHFGGFRDVMEHVLLLDMSIHPFDMARFLAGGDPVAVTAHEWNPPNSWYRHGASAIATFEFQDGVVFNYRGSWCSQGFTTEWNGSWRILGEKGSVLWNGAEKFEAEVVTPKKDAFLWPKKTVEVPLLPEKMFPKHQHTSLIVELLRCIEEGREPETTITDNIRSLAMVHGAIASAAKQRRVVL
jgi:predicted dehydrogenase